MASTTIKILRSAARAMRYRDDEPMAEFMNEELFVWDKAPQTAMTALRCRLSELDRALTAEVGSRFYRDLDLDPSEKISPYVVEATEDEQPEEFPDDPTFSWPALGQAHRRECGWDFRPSGGLWVGWFMPETWSGGQQSDGHWAGMATGALVAFVRVDDGVVTNIHTATAYRRQGIATRLLGHVRDTYDITVLRGPFTEAGAALRDAVSVNAPES